ncbi:hypothetical protein [Bacteroides fragilis]|uniref:hypothetical protein n=1 Tax=Bacteroides fragilis TaxID=817 RepID=UPI0015ABD9A6|nr:hypothetical protein [Bacteroides fragilis]MCS3230659.1 hypothetical protein [Bacteroides thetaiotaomicron]MCZ2709077.1 hypothetical protein [Bacteroides fragilis]
MTLTARKEKIRIKGGMCQSKIRQEALHSGIPCCFDIRRSSGMERHEADCRCSGTAFRTLDCRADCGTDLLPCFMGGKSRVEKG